MRHPHLSGPRHIVQVVRSGLCQAMLVVLLCSWTFGSVVDRRSSHGGSRTMAERLATVDIASVLLPADLQRQAGWYAEMVPAPIHRHIPIAHRMMTDTDVPIGWSTLSTKLLISRRASSEL